MSMIAQTIKEVTTRYEKGEVVILDDIPREVMGEERLFHYIVYTTANLPVGAANVAMNILNLRPEANEVYNIEHMGIDGAAQIRIEFPSGATRNTPHQLALVYDQILMPKAPSDLFSSLVNFWTVPDRFPTVRATNPLQVAIDTVVYFYGWKYRVRVISAEEVELKRAQGIRVLEAESYYPTS
jgi:hypothetical protein